jgi:hypothetical protein
MSHLCFTEVIYHLQKIAEDAIEVRKVANGVIHCENHGLNWHNCALSYEHLAKNQTLAELLAGSQLQPLRKIRENLRLENHVRAEDMGLPLGHIGDIKNYGILRFLWVHAAILKASAHTTS